jgi:hypothetical protein
MEAYPMTLRNANRLALLLFLLSAGRLDAQQPAAAPAPPARPEDVASVDAILQSLYQVISGPAGQARDWDRMRSLFAPGARLMPVVHPQSGGPATTRILTPEDYITTVGPRLEQMGFFEREIGRVTETFGGVTHAMSAYESKRTAEDAQPFARGINSIQLLNDGTRWWVVSIFWDGERPDNPIPAKYLSGSSRNP